MLYAASEWYAAMGAPTGDVHVMCLAKFFAFVDDFLLVGETREATQLASEEFERLLEEFGISWAPHKQRGPCRCINFLGLMLCNAPGQQVVALTEARQQRIEEELHAVLRCSMPRPGTASAPPAKDGTPSVGAGAGGEAG